MTHQRLSLHCFGFGTEWLDDIGQRTKVTETPVMNATHGG